MKLSVMMTTYNHEKFIARALDSVLEQETDFHFEVVVGEDASTDTTREKLLMYQEKFGDRLRLNLHRENLGRRENWLQTFKACRGQYIALLEGDDHWTHPHKLQRQVDLLDDHPRWAICFHDALSFHEDGSQPPQPLRPDERKSVYGLEDLLHRNFIPTASCVFRNGLFQEFPDFFHDLPMGDWPLHVLNARHGGIGYLPEIWSVYRIHRGGVWASQDQPTVLENEIKFYEAIQTCLEREYTPLIRKELAGRYLQLARANLQVEDLPAARRSLWAFLKSRPFRTIATGSVIGLILRCTVPGLYQGLKRLPGLARRNINLP